MDDRTITITTDKGEQIVCDILFTTHLDQFNKDYVVFVKRDTNECTAASYVEGKDGMGSLDVIETDAEWNELEKLLNNYIENQSKAGGCQGHCGGGCSSCGGDCDCDGECSGDCDCSKEA